MSLKTLESRSDTIETEFTSARQENRKQFSELQSMFLMLTAQLENQQSSKNASDKEMVMGVEVAGEIGLGEGTVQESSFNF